MAKSNRGIVVGIIFALILPIVIMGFQDMTSQPSIWIVYANGQDRNIDMAIDTFERDMAVTDYKIGEMSFDEIGNLPLYSDAVILIGHGTPEGLEVSGDILPWPEVVTPLKERRPQIGVLLACYSPSDPESNLFGFEGQIDAEAGALLAAWHVKRLIGSNTEESVPTERIFAAQYAMMNPLESWVYFVHGFHGSDNQFLDLVETLELWDALDGYDDIGHFDYFEDYSSHGDAHAASIEEFAVNFKDKLIAEHPAGTQIDIVAHSMGGLITRQMLMTQRETLESSGIEIARVITLGTPHLGTSIAAFGIGPAIITILDLFYFPEPWICDVFYQMAPDHDFITTLNDDPMSYSSGIEWYTFSAISNSGWAIAMFPVHLDANDVPVASGRAHLSFATPRIIEDCEHNQLINDTQQRTYADISTWLAGGIDSDNDGLLDVEERRVYSTDVYDSDSDNDGLSDGAEVNTYNTDPLDSDSDNDGLSDRAEVISYGTNPNAWSTDADILSDGQEIAWGYDPLNSNDPITASNLVSSAWQRNGKGYVRANHYTAMDYVKVYVKYKDSYGYWTSYMYVGTDTTPYYGDDYYVSWTYLAGYVQMRVKVQAYDSAGHYLGSDSQYVTLPGGGGGGGGGGGPVPD